MLPIHLDYAPDVFNLNCLYIQVRKARKKCSLLLCNSATVYVRREIFSWGFNFHIFLDAHQGCENYFHTNFIECSALF